MKNKRIFNDYTVKNVPKEILTSIYKLQNQENGQQESF